MSGTEQAGDLPIEKILERLQSLELRLSGIEARLGAGKTSEDDVLPERLSESTVSSSGEEEIMELDEAGIESSIGENGLAWLGSLVLFFGIIFLTIYTTSLGYPVFSTVLGFAASIGVFILVHFLRRSFPHLVFMLNISGHLLLYYMTLRLYFFSANPLVPVKGIDLILVFLVIGIQLYFALKEKSELKTSIAMVLAVSTALISDQMNITLPLLTLISAAAFYFFVKYEWWRLTILLLILVYLSHLLWLMNNPLLGHPFEMIPPKLYSAVFLFITGALFSSTALDRRYLAEPRQGLNALILLNAFCFSLIILVVTILFFEHKYVGMFATISAFCLAFSVALKILTKSRFTPSFFACFGFMAMSVSVYGLAHLPDAYFWLTLQSFLVVSMALWFRSRIIVVANAFLYLGLLVIYLSFSPSLNTINFCFAFVAFATARILNWKRERLTLRTDLMRNMYLIILFFTMLYAFYHAIPGPYITLSWTAVAAAYFILSMILHNIKYRWMAIGTILVTVIYLFLVDLAHLSVGYRVVAFLFLAVISFSASLYYTKRIKKKKEMKTQ
jgi:hypothetical protein